MTAEYDIDVDRASLQRAIALFEFVGGNMDDALRIAINKTAPKVRTAASTEIRKQVRLTAAYVRENLTVKKATRGSLSGKLTTPSRGIMLSRFSTDSAISGGRPFTRRPATPPRGISVKVKASGPAQKVDGKHGNGVFYVLLNRGQTVGIAERVPGTRKIEVLHGPSLSQVFNTVRADVMPMAREEYQKQVLDAMRYILRQQRPPEPVA